MGLSLYHATIIISNDYFPPTLPFSTLISPRPMYVVVIAKNRCTVVDAVFNTDTFKKGKEVGFIAFVILLMMAMNDHTSDCDDDDDNDDDDDDRCCCCFLVLFLIIITVLKIMMK